MEERSDGDESDGPEPPPLHAAENERPASSVVHWQPFAGGAAQSAQAVGQPAFTSSGDT